MNTDLKPIGVLDGVTIKPCVSSGFCCTKSPCAYGEANEKGACKHLTEPNELGQMACGRYDWIKANVPNWEYYPAFGAGCCMPMFNEMREKILIKIKEKQNEPKL